MPDRILIIEDNVDNMELMSYLLEAFGYQTLQADNGLTGIEFADREQPGLILCDIRLPGIDGYEVARRLKQDARLRTIPLIAITASATTGVRDRALATGFNGYITKPIAPETFVNDVEAFLNLERQSNAARARSCEDMVLQGSEAPVTPTMFRGTILVVDNLPSNLDLARSILEPSGFRVLAALDVNSALRMAHRERPDVILSDVNMPEGTGFELASRVRHDPSLGDVPVVLISSSLSRDEAGASRAAAAGATKFLSRPIDPRVLLEELQSCINLVK
jgi:two-component system cell cycle response regulator